MAQMNGGMMDAKEIYTYGGYFHGWLVEYLYDRERDQASLAWRDPRGIISSGKSVAIKGQLYKPQQKLPVFGCDLLGVKKTARELATNIENYLDDSFLTPTEYISKLLAYWVMSTYQYDQIDQCVYLKIIGIAGSGKTELLRRLGMICYHAIEVNPAEPMALLSTRIKEDRCTLLFDDTDSFIEGEDFSKFYNLGAAYGNPIWKTVKVADKNKEQAWELKNFETYCPKVFSMRDEKESDLLWNRALPIHLRPQGPDELTEIGIPLTIDPVMRKEAQRLRSDLLRWRMGNWQPRINANCDIERSEENARIINYFWPLFAICNGDEELEKEILDTLTAIHKNPVDK
jgi:hypothetical protein